MPGGPHAVVFDLFHTLVDPEPLRPPGFDEVAAVAAACLIDERPFREFWASTYVERETTPIDLVDLVRRHTDSVGAAVTDAQHLEIDEIFGVAKDAAIRHPLDETVDLIRVVAASSPVGVLSNCHMREVRAWPESPLATSVTAFGRSCRIGLMKPDPTAYTWVTDRLAVAPDSATYVGNGGSDELVGARRAGFATVVHSNLFDRSNGLVDPDEQLRRARQADVSVDSIDDLWHVLGVDAAG